MSLFPEIINALNYGITKRAIETHLIKINIWNPRDFTQDKYHTVDDRPYGGGPGMVMMVEPLKKAIEAAKQAAPEKPTIIYLSPQGKRFDQETAQLMLNKKHLVFVSGRYEGIDERLLQSEIDEEWSIGDYVLSGGELAAMVMIDAITRLIPGALGHEDSAAEDSLNTGSTGLLKYPQYTRPEKINNLEVPSVLLSGNHQDIADWRLKQTLGRTWLKRPDLLTKANLTKKELLLLMMFIEEYTNRRGDRRSP